MNMPKSTKRDRAAGARLPTSRFRARWLRCGPTAGLLDVLGERTDLEEVVLYAGLLLRPYTLLLTSFA